MRKIASLLTMLMLLCTFAFGQTRTITGQIKDEKGDPVPFATVKIKGTKKGTAADAGGLFTLEVAKAGNSGLVISSQGFAEKEVAVGTSNFIEISLKATGQLQEVVVTTALGIKRSKNKLPYAAQTVSGEEISKSRTSNFASTLSGKVAGLDIKQSNALGGSTNIILRGNRSISGSNQALIVVDGIPYDNSAFASAGGQRTGRGGYDFGNTAADINPDDIDNVSVLKVAAASALYGSRGFNGVILITTKKGSKGLGITINTGVTSISTDKSTFPTYQKEYGGGYGQYYEDPSGYFLYRDHTDWSDLSGTGPDFVVPTSEDASYGAPFDASKQVFLWDAFDPTSPNFAKARPWVAAKNDPYKFLESPINFNTSIFIEGGNDKSTFKLGYTRNDDKGILPNSKITKDLLSLSSTLNITNRLSAFAALNFSKIKGIGRYGSGYDDKNPMSSFRQWWEVNNDILELKDAYFRTRKNVTWNWADPSNLVPIYWDNPYFIRHESFETDSRNRYFGNIGLNYKITNYLSFLGRISLDSYDGIQEERIAVGTVGVPGYSRINNSYREYNYDFLASFDKDIVKDLNLKAILGTNIRRQTTSSISVGTNGGLVVPRLYALSNSKNQINPPQEFYGTREVDGYFAGATLTYKNYLIADGTLRRDYSSTLPKDNNAYYYPSISGGFIFSNLLKNLGWLSYGKLRANYAGVRGDAPLYSITDTYVNFPSFGDETLFGVSTSKKNNELRPEHTTSYEYGIEASFLKSRVGFDATYYIAKTIDQIIPVEVSRATGYNSKFVNSGTVRNRGIEISLTGTPVKTTDLIWSVNVNWTRNRNKVLDLYSGVDNLLLGSFQGGVSINATKGQPYGTIRGNDFVYIGTNADGTPDRNSAKVISKTTGRYLLTSASNIVIGDPNPDWIGGITNSVRYKEFTLSFLIDVRHGGQLFSLDQYYGLATGLYPETAGLNDKGHPIRSLASDFNGEGGILRDGVDPDGKPNIKRASAVNYGAYGYRYSPAAGFIYDASYVKLREASINYSLPKSLLSKIAPFKGIDFSLVGRNLWIIHKNLPYSDPEDSYGSGNLQGYQGNAYPATRSIAFNIRFKF